MMKCVLAGAMAGLILLAAPTLMTPALAQSSTAKPATTTKAKKPVSAGQAAMHERQKKCGAEWKAAKAAGKVQKGMTWPKYWSACNKRLKGS
jgi:hypothetical protein